MLQSFQDKDFEELWLFLVHAHRIEFVGGTDLALRRAGFEQVQNGKFCVYQRKDSNFVAVWVKSKADAIELKQKLMIIKNRASNRTKNKEE